MGWWIALLVLGILVGLGGFARAWQIWFKPWSKEALEATFKEGGRLQAGCASIVTCLVVGGLMVWGGVAGIEGEQRAPAGSQPQPQPSENQPQAERRSLFERLSDSQIPSVADYLRLHTEYTDACSLLNSSLEGAAQDAAAAANRLELLLSTTLAHVATWDDFSQANDTRALESLHALADARGRQQRCVAQIRAAQDDLHGRWTATTSGLLRLHNENMLSQVDFEAPSVVELLADTSAFIDTSRIAGDSQPATSDALKQTLSDVLETVRAE